MNVYGRLVAILLLALECYAQTAYTLHELQGAWWSDTDNPTADFAIAGEAVWLDSDANYHPCSINNGDVLVFEPGSENERVEHRIISLDVKTLVLENLITGQRAVYTRNE